MKGYCVDVRGFSVDKKRLVIKAIVKLTGKASNIDEESTKIAEKIVTVGPSFGVQFNSAAFGTGELTENQIKCSISFNDLMSEAGLDYVEDGEQGFKELDIMEAEKEKERLLGLLHDSIATSAGIDCELKKAQHDLRMKMQEIGSLRSNLRETEKELKKSRISGAVIFTCLVVVAISNLFFGG